MLKLGELFVGVLFILVVFEFFFPHHHGHGFHFGVFDSLLEDLVLGQVGVLDGLAKHIGLDRAGRVWNE